MINENEWLVVGLITSPHGVNGKVKVKSLSDFEERFTKPGIRWIQKDKENPSEIELTAGYQQPGKETFILSFKEIFTRGAAEKLKKHKLLVKHDSLPKLKKGEFHLNELTHLKVKVQKNSKLVTIGKIINLESEKNNLLVIKLLENNKEVLVPFVNEIVPVIDTKNKFIIINPPTGLFEL